MAACVCAVLFHLAASAKPSTRTSYVCRSVWQWTKQRGYLGSLTATTLGRWPSPPYKLCRPSLTPSLTSLVTKKTSYVWSLVPLIRSEYHAFSRWYLYKSSIEAHCYSVDKNRQFLEWRTFQPQWLVNCLFHNQEEKTFMVEMSYNACVNAMSFNVLLCLLVSLNIKIVYLC